MGADPISLGLSAVSGVGNMVGGKNAQKQQQQAQQAQQQLSQNELNMVQGAYNQYESNVAPGVQSLTQGLASGSNPYVQQQQGNLSNLGNFGSSTQNQALSNYGQSGMNQQLANWSGLKPQELSALTTNAANSGMSDINTLMSRGGAGGNQNALAQDLLLQNQQGAESAAVNIGSNASQQEVGALESANQTGLSGLNAGTGYGLSGLQGAASGGQNLLNSVLSGTQGLYGLLNPSAVAGGASSLGNMANQYGQQATAGGNPYAPAIGSLGQIGAQYGNMTAGKGGSSGGGFVNTNPNANGGWLGAGTFNPNTINTGGSSGATAPGGS